MKAPAVPRVDFYRPSRWSFDTSGWLLPLGAVFLAIILGALTSVLPGKVMVMTMAGLVVLGLSVVKPFVGLIGALVLIFDVLPAQYQPGLGKLRAYDAMVVFLAAVVMLQALARREAIIGSLRSFIWPLLYLTVCLATSLVYVKYYAPNEAMLSEARAQFMWLLLPMMILGIDSRERFKYFVIGVLMIGAVIALYASLESLLQIRIASEDVFEPLDVYGNSDIVRNRAGGGTYIMIFALLLSVNMMIERRLAWFFGLPLASLLALGIAVQYGRGIWVATVAGLLLSAFLHRGRRGVVWMSVIGICALTVFVGTMAIVKPRVAEALVERATGIGEELESGGSFGFRKIENHFALNAIRKSPILGVGIGGQYKPTVSAAGSFGNETTYIHNAWLWFPLKMGLWAFFIPFVFIFCFYREILRGLKLQAGRPTEGRWFLGTVAGAFVVPVITSYTQPEWAAPQGISAFAILMGCALLYLRWGSPLAQGPLPTAPR